MQNNDLEKGLQERLYDYEETVDTDLTWLAVQQGLQPAKKKKRGLGWWWFSGLLLLAFGGLLAWQLYRPADQEARPRVAERAGIAESGGTDARASVTPPGFPGTPANTDQPLTEASSAAPEHFDSPTGKPVATRPDNTPSERIVSPTPRAFTGNSPSGRAPKAPAALVAPAGTNQRPTTGTTRQADAPKTQVGTATPLDNAAAPVAVLPILPLEGTGYDPTTPPFSELKGPTDCPVFVSRHQPGWTVEAAAGLSALRDVLASGTPEPNDQFLRNQRTTSPLEALSFDLLAGYHTANGWSLRSGLGYQRFNSLAAARVDTTETTRVEGITEIIINGPGDTTFVMGMVEAATRTSRVNRHYNQLTTFNLPLLLGKRFRFGTWRVLAEGGPVFNLISRGSARYQLSDGSFSSRAENSDLFRRRLAGVSWQANLAVSRQIQPGLTASVGLSGFRQSRRGFEVAGSLTNTSYDLLGIRLGISRHF